MNSPHLSASTGLCIPLQTSIVGRNGSISCDQDIVTYTCTVAAPAHTWKIESFDLNAAITRGTPTFSDSRFTIRTTADDTFITTALTVSAFPQLNGTNITCEDGIARPGEGEIQDTVAMVFGEFSNYV